MIGRCGLSSESLFVGQVEALGQVVVDLNRAELPLPPDRVANHEIEFRAIERGLAQLDRRLESLLGGGFDDGLFGFVPVFVRTDVLLLVVRVAQRNLSRELVETERLEDVDDVDHLHELLFELVRKDKMWASSCVKPRTRVSPCSSPLCS